MTSWLSVPTTISTVCTTRQYVRPKITPTSLVHLSNSIKSIDQSQQAGSVMVDRVQGFSVMTGRDSPEIWETINPSRQPHLRILLQSVFEYTKSIPQ